MDAAIVALYRERDGARVRSRWVRPLVRLERLGPMTISDLAQEVGLTHSALSQTVAQMRTAGLVESTPGPDGRTRVTSLTTQGRALVPLAEAEWRATEAAVAELDAELPYPLTRVAADLAAALAARSFADRLAAHMDEGPHPGRPAGLEPEPGSRDADGVR